MLNQAQHVSFLEFRKTLPYFCGVRLLACDDKIVRNIAEYFAKLKRNDITHPLTEQQLHSRQQNIAADLIEDQFRQCIGKIHETSAARNLIYYEGKRSAHPTPNRYVEIDVIIGAPTAPTHFLEVKYKSCVNLTSRSASLKIAPKENRIQVLKQGARLSALNHKIRGAVVYVFDSDQTMEQFLHYNRETTVLDIGRDSDLIESNFRNQLKKGFSNQAIPTFAIQRSNLNATSTALGVTCPDLTTPQINLRAEQLPKIPVVSAWEALDQLKLS